MDRIDRERLRAFVRENAERICRDHLPHGRLVGGEWVVGDESGAPGNSRAGAALPTRVTSVAPLSPLAGGVGSRVCSVSFVGELSAARAISVVRNAIDQGIPADRLAAAGFADNQPLDKGTTDDAYRRNRRIELKLTER